MSLEAITQRVLLSVVGSTIPQVITWFGWSCYAVASNEIWTYGNHLPYPSHKMHTLPPYIIVSCNLTFSKTNRNQRNSLAEALRAKMHEKDLLTNFYAVLHVFEFEFNYMVIKVMVYNCKSWITFLSFQVTIWQEKIISIFLRINLAWIHSSTIGKCKMALTR